MKYAHISTWMNAVIVQGRHKIFTTLSSLVVFTLCVCGGGVEVGGGGGQAATDGREWGLQHKL